MSTAPGYYALARPEILPFLPSGYSKVLEIGCAEGNFRGAYPPECEVWGCEVNEAAAAKAANRLSKVLVGRYDDVADKIPAGSFDLIVCNDVIEHMADHDGFLVSAREKLRPGGFLTGSIPNVRYIENIYELLVLGDWKYREAGILDRTHLRFFTRNSLVRTLEGHGFRIEKLEGINSVPERRFRIAAAILKAVTLGRWADMPYLQFAFRARKDD
ncbi:MAG TPA: class I SAM-dependent methyltransferase [Fibrobacteria bacterium]|jgi:2-polyprenyl-3-methyl-5-hydroxy-6-metoxy-1,4-benzoquinol methylase|nr:class I SAM-dependent methyltransferase [Fibrobacteria bacterium]